MVFATYFILNNPIIMDTLSQDLQSLFERDLKRLIKNLEDLPEDKLWETREGITNSCGVLVQHLVGNLNFFVGTGLGVTGFERERKKEFEPSYVPKDELIGDVRELIETLDLVFKKMDDEKLSGDYPMDIPFDHSTQKFLAHLYGHLNYHLGQINYLRRMLSA